jgi:hypothetical protein
VRQDSDTPRTIRGPGGGSVAVVNNRMKLLTVVCALLSALVVGACSRAESAASVPAADAPKLLWMGDSVADGLAGPLADAAATSGLQMQSIASTGGGNVSGIAELTTSTWEQLTARLASFSPDVVAYQVSTYDWGTEDEQRAAYERLLKTVTDAGATLVFVTMPPIRVDGFYADHMEELERTSRLVAEVADGSGGKAVAWDSAEVWGSSYQLDRDGKRDRSPDGVHTCPQGAARFTAWLLDHLAAHYPGFTPAAPESWANAGWAAGPAFQGC